MKAGDAFGGCVVVVRPDRFVTKILALDDHAGLAAVFDAFMIPAD